MSTGVDGALDAGVQRGRADLVAEADDALGDGLARFDGHDVQRDVQLGKVVAQQLKVAEDKVDPDGSAVVCLVVAGRHDVEDDEVLALLLRDLRRQRKGAVVLDAQVFPATVSAFVQGLRTCASSRRPYRRRAA